MAGQMAFVGCGHEARLQAAFRMRPLAMAPAYRGDGDCNACAVDCDSQRPGMGMAGQMAFVGCGQGEYYADTTYRFVGYGGDFTNGRRRRDFTCLICTVLSLLPGLLAVLRCIWPADECEIDQVNWP